MVKGFNRAERSAFDTVAVAVFDFFRSFGYEGELTCTAEQIIFRHRDRMIKCGSDVAALLQMKRAFEKMAHELIANGIDPKGVIESTIR